MKSFLKTVINSQKNCLITLLILIVILEILININNMIIQSLGICILPVIFLLVVNLFKNDQRKRIN